MMKLMVYLREELEVANNKIGREALGKLLRKNNLLVPKTKRFFITTDTKHFFYKSPNLLKETEMPYFLQCFKLIFHPTGDKNLDAIT